MSRDVTASAAAATQPAHRPARGPQSLDGIVDPNLLPPPPPRAKPKVTQVPVVCRLCSTRLYAPLENVGQMIRCPDCHSVNEIKLPPELARQSQPKPPAPPPIPELEPTPSGEPERREDDRGHKGMPADVWHAYQPPKPTRPTPPAAPAAHAAEDDLMLSETVERPTYRPLVDPRGEYAVLKAMDPEVRAAGWSDPGSEPANAAQPKKPPPAKTPVPAAKGVVAMEPEPHEVEEEFTISEPVERIEIKPEPIKLPKFDPDESLYDGRYDDDLFGEVDPKQPQSWKRSPFLLGVLGFLFLPNTITRWLLFSLGLALAAMFFNIATHYALTPDKPTEQVYAIFFAIAFSVTFGFWLAPFCTAMLGVIQDTANGSNDVENWPDWNIVEWFYPMLFVPFAALLSGLPGMFFTSMLLGTGLDPRIGMAAAAAPLMLSWIVLFPLVMYSMLAEGSVLSPFSPHTLRSLKVASDGWIVFYMASILLSLVGTAAGSFMMSRYLILSVLGAWGTVTCMLLYARLLGRLMWYSAQREAKLEAEEAQAS